MRPSVRKITNKSFVLTAMLALACLALMAARPLAITSRGEAPAGPDQTLSPYFVVLSEDPEKDALPLKSTRADVKIAGNVAEVLVTQHYQNQGKKTLEAIYVFPASTQAAVHAMRMTVGERVIEAEIMERQQARQTYEQAKQEGQTTSLLEQQRPNVFQMNVANILPGDKIKVELEYMELLAAEDQVYEFVYPTVVGPRYSKMEAEGAPDTDKWVESPYLHEGEPPTYDFGLKVNLHSGLPLSQLASPSHEVEVKYTDPQTAEVTLKDGRTGGNKDFVLRYALVGNKIDTGLLLYPGEDENFFLLMLEPPARVASAAVLPREYIFIVDVSGSMHGFPLDITKALMQDIITQLRPQDFLNVLLFAGSNAVLSQSRSLPASEANKRKALEWIKAQPGGGGTQILPAFQRALSLPRTPGTSCIVVVATDGFVHVESQTFEVIRQSLGEANLFAFGIGKSVNRFLIEGMAQAGVGEPFIILDPGEAGKQAERFRRYIASPVLTNIQVSFEGFEAAEIEPAKLPDLFALRPLTLLGKYSGAPTGAIVVQGKTAQGDFHQRVEVAAGKASPDNSAIRLLWARQRIRRLADYGPLEKDSQAVKEVTALGLKYSLMTPYTSFVAVDQVKRADGQIVTVKQPLPLPEGVSELAVGRGGMGKSFWGALGGYTDSSLAEAPLTTTPPQPGLSIRVIKVKGELAPAAVKQSLEAKLDKLKACCDQAAARGVKLPPEILLSFTISADGQVESQEVIKSTLKDKTLRDCLTKIVRGLIFAPPGKKSVAVTAKLVLPGN